MSEIKQYPQDRPNDDRTYVERFTPTELMTLRKELLESGADSFQAAEIVANFLSGRGYGVSSQGARSAASRWQCEGCWLQVPGCWVAQ